MSFFLSWHLLDIFFLLLGCYFIIRGAFRGFVGEILSFGGLIVSVYIGVRHSETLGGLLGSAAGLSKEVAQVLAVVLVWIVISLLFGVLRRVLKRILDFASLGGIDRIFGVLIGFLKTVIVVYMVIIGGLLLAPVVEPTWMGESTTLVYAGRKWPEVKQFLVNSRVLPERADLPGGTLEQILRPYRRGTGAPSGYGVPAGAGGERLDGSGAVEL